MKVSLVAFFLFAIAMPGMAQRGSSGKSSGSAKYSNARSQATKGNSRSASLKGQPQARLKSSVTASPRIAEANASATKIVVVNRYVGGGCCRFWWPGGVYFGGWYGPGWYYPGAYYPGYWYWNGGLGFNFGFYPYISAPGVKFELDEVSKKERKEVEDGKVYLGDAYYGRVKDFSGAFKRALPLQPGNHEITIALQDGRRFDVKVAVQNQRVTKVGLRFDENPPQNPTPPIGPKGEDKLTPAPAKE